MKSRQALSGFLRKRHGSSCWVDMNVTELCAARREELLGMWVERFISSYPLQSAGFVRTSTDPFANPVGQTTRASLGILFDAVIGLDASPREVKGALDDLIPLAGDTGFHAVTGCRALVFAQGHSAGCAVRRRLFKMGWRKKATGARRRGSKPPFLRNTGRFFQCGSPS